MADRAVWQTRYAVELQSAFGTSVSNLTKGVQDQSLAGINVSKSGVLFNEASDINPGVTILDQEKTTGSASRRAGAGAEYQQGIQDPNISVTMHVITRAIFPFLETFFQGGRVTSAAANKWYTPHSWTTGVVDSGSGKAFTLVQDLGTDQSKKVRDMITTSIELSADDNNNVSAAMDLMGGNLSTSYDPSSDDFNYAAVNPVNWINSVSYIGNTTTALEEMYVPGFSVTLNNNAVAKHYASEFVQRFQLNNFTGEGTITFPWNLNTTNFEDNTILNRFINGNVTRVVFGWNDTSISSPSDLYTLGTDNYMTLALLLRLNDATVGGDDEQTTEGPFDLVEAPTLTSSNISGWASDAAGTQITLTFSGSETCHGNVFPGDKIIFHDAAANDETWFTVESVDSSTEFTIDSSVGSSDSGSEMTMIGMPVNLGINDSQAR